MLEGLKLKFSSSVNWNQARIEFISRFLIALFQVRTVNLSEIASVFGGKAKEESHYKRLQRFFKDYTFKQIEIVKLLFAFFPLANAKVKLVMDRTNWKYGKININILTLAVIYNDIAFPIFWKLLDKRGNSNTDERIEIMKDFISVFGVGKIEYLLADREFIGKDWIAFLQGNHISFIIRIKENTLIPNSKGIFKKAKYFFYGLKDKQVINLPKQRLIWGQSVYVSGCRLAEQGLLIVITDKQEGDAVEKYAERWKIETLFGFLKTKGFCLEDTHLTNPDRIGKLFAILAIAFCWAYTLGEVLTQSKPITIKKHGRKAISVFKKGFKFIRKLFSSLDIIITNQYKALIIQSLLKYNYDISKIVLY